MITLTYPDSLAAYKGINRTLIFNRGLVNSYGLTMSNQVHLYDVLVKIERSFIPEDFNFSALSNYTQSKASSLFTNYVDLEQYQEVQALVLHRELKKDRNYNIAFHFSNIHGGGKGCLLTLTFARRYGQKEPILIANVRASESMKRLMFDFLLIDFLGKQTYGETPFRVQVFFPYIWGGSDWLASFLATDTFSRKKIKKATEDTFAYRVYEVYNKILKTSKEEMENYNYHALKRAWKVIHKETINPPLLASMVISNWESRF